LVLCEQLDDRHRQSTLINNLSIIAAGQGDYFSAHHYLQRGLDLAKTNGDLAAQGLVLVNLGKNYRLMGKTELATKSLKDGLQISESIGSRALIATALLYLAETIRESDPKRAESLYRQVLNIAQRDNLQLIECEVLIGMAELLHKSNQCEARQYSLQSMKLAEMLQNSKLSQRAMTVNQNLNMTQV